MSHLVKSGSANMTVIFNLQKLLISSFFFFYRHHNCWSCAYLAAITLGAAAAEHAGDLTHIVFSHNHLPFLTHLGS